MGVHRDVPAFEAPFKLPELSMALLQQKWGPQGSLDGDQQAQLVHRLSVAVVRTSDKTRRARWCIRTADVSSAPPRSEQQRY